MKGGTTMRVIGWSIGMEFTIAALQAVMAVGLGGEAWLAALAGDLKIQQWPLDFQATNPVSAGRWPGSVGGSFTVGHNCKMGNRAGAGVSSFTVGRNCKRV